MKSIVLVVVFIGFVCKAGFLLIFQRFPTSLSQNTAKIIQRCTETRFFENLEKRDMEFGEASQLDDTLNRLQLNRATIYNLDQSPHGGAVLNSKVVDTPQAPSWGLTQNR